VGKKPRLFRRSPFVPQLLLPSEDARLVSGFFRFGDHAFALISARDGSPGENIVGVERQNAPRGLNGAVKILLGVIGLRQAMQRVAKFRIEFQRARVFRDCFREFSFAEKIDARVVMVFRVLRSVTIHTAILAPVPPC
jgi:hypothetical protein